MNTDPGLIQIITPAAPWKRKLFNGLAQVLVQSGKEEGKVRVTATAPGLKPAVLKLNAKKADPRPAVE